MPKFDQKSIGGAIEYDFVPWGGNEGTVPEPSKFQVKRFMRQAQETFKKLEVIPEDAPDDDMSPNDLVGIMNNVDNEELFEKLTEGLNEALAELCGNSFDLVETPNPEGGMPIQEKVWRADGSPTFAVLSALPYRPFMGFFGYLMEAIMNPESSGRATSNSPVRLKSV